MFKIGKLKQVENEDLSIKVINWERKGYKNGGINTEIVKSLSFYISGNNCSFTFMLNCNLEELLKIPKSERIDFKDYIFPGETLLHTEGENDCIDPNMNIEIIRYLKNKYIICIDFCTYSEEKYDDDGGRIEFSFNLDDYLSSK